MKTKDKIILFIILIVALLGTWVTNAQETKLVITDSFCNSNLIYNPNVVDNNLRFYFNSFTNTLYKVKKSKKKYFTVYKITVYERNYYTNIFELINGYIYFNEYKRDGSLKNGYEFPISKVQIYKSK